MTEIQVLTEVAQFKTRTGVFGVRTWAWQAFEKGDLDAAGFWTGYFEETALSKVFKALQAIPVTSAATERNWSIRGAIHTKVRNR